MSETFADSKELCVGSWEEQQQYPYKDYLLRKIPNPSGIALDFGCGPGRMMLQMLSEFEEVHGGDIIQNNLRFAEDYLGSDKNYYLHKLNGSAINIEGENRFDFIYSTIVIHHIAPFEIRDQIFKDIYRLLKKSGKFAIQVVFGIDTGFHWFESPYKTIRPQKTVDVSIPDVTHLPEIETWLRNIGFIEVDFSIEDSPHAGADPNLKWLFIYGTK